MVVVEDEPYVVCVEDERHEQNRCQDHSRDSQHWRCVPLKMDASRPRRFDDSAKVPNECGSECLSLLSSYEMERRPTGLS